MPNYSYQRSDYWGDGHWIMSEYGRVLGRASAQEDGKWSAFIEYLPPTEGQKFEPVKEDCRDLYEVVMALREEWQARDMVSAFEVGIDHGWSHANYVDAYGPPPKTAPGEPGPLAKTRPSRFTAGHGGDGPLQKEYGRGWQTGIRRFKAGKNLDGSKCE